MIDKAKIKELYKEKIEAATDSGDDESIKIYTTALQKIDSCPDGLEWALTHRDFEQWKADFMAE